jgi:hypothetical protein
MDLYVRYWRTFRTYSTALTKSVRRGEPDIATARDGCDAGGSSPSNSRASTSLSDRCLQRDNGKPIGGERWLSITAIHGIAVFFAALAGRTDPATFLIGPWSRYIPILSAGTGLFDHQWPTLIFAVAKFEPSGHHGDIRTRNRILIWISFIADQRAYPQTRGG